jgi:threonine dehydrogenase-like Zn-dependent dehydrogenase
VGLYGVRQSRNVENARILVLGAGSVALCAIWWARRLGAAKIAVLSRSQRRADMALAMGADAFVVSGENETTEITAALGGEPDIVFECVGQPAFLAKGIAHVRKFGEVISMGFCTAPDHIVPAMTAFKAATLKFPVGYALCDFERCASEMNKGHALPNMLVTAEIGLTELPDTITSLRQANTETKVHVVI